MNARINQSHQEFLLRCYSGSKDLLKQSLCSLTGLEREEIHRPQTTLKYEVEDILAKPGENASILIMCFITASSGPACLFGRFKAANNSLIVSSFQMTGSGHNLPKLGPSVLLIIKAEVAMPGMFAISPLLFPMDSRFIITLAK